MSSFVSRWQAPGDSASQCRMWEEPNLGTAHLGQPVIKFSDPERGYVTFLSFNFLTCKMGIMITELILPSSSNFYPLMTL